MSTALLLVALACAPTKEAVQPPAAEPEPAASAPHPITRVVRSGSAGPRVVVLHGYGATPDGIAGLMAGFPGEARVLAPQAPTPALDGWSWFPLSREVGGPDGLGPGIAAAADDLAAWLVEEGAGPDAPVVVTGFSQGGMLSFALAVRHPELVSLAVPMGGMLPPDLLPAGAPPATAPPIRAWHGGADTRVPTALARRTVDALAAAGWDATLQTVDGAGHTVPRQARDGLHAAVAAGR
jgi:phospholipase/carboxylesterase